MAKVLLFLLLIFPFVALAGAQIDINMASLAQLDELAGIGPKYAQAIIDARPFSSVDDLSRVKGIGNGTRLQKIKDQGLAFVSGQTPVPAQIPVVAQNIATNSPTADDTPIVYPTGVVINEILPNPAGPDEAEEWIELYNSNNSDVDLSGWQVKDTAGTITTFTIPQNTKILANGFLLLKRPAIKIMLNNDQDGLGLLTPNGKTVDSVSFIKAPLGQSYNKTSSGWQWSTTLTPEAKNIVTAVATKTPLTNSGPNGLSNTKNSVKNDGVELGLADLSQTNQNNTSENPWFLFFTALAITIISASIILFIKLKFSKKQYERT